MISRQRATSLLLALLVLGLIAHIPAWMLYKAIAPKTSPIQVLGLEGAWTNAHLAGVTHNGQPLVQDLSLQFEPLKLLLGRVSYHLTGGGDLGQINAHLSRGPKALRLSNSHISGSFKRFASLANYGLPLDGQVEAQIDQLVLVNNFPTDATATLQLKSLSFKLVPPGIPLGDFLAEVRTTPEAIIADITSPAGPLEAKGAARLFPDRHYDLDLVLKLKPGAPEQLGNYLRSMGSPDAQGYTHVRQNGVLP